MAKSSPINVTISGDYTDKEIKKAIRDLDSLRTDADKTSGKFGDMSKMAKVAGAAIAAGLAVGAAAAVSFTKDAVMAASNLAESQSKVGVVFGQQAQLVQNWAKNSALAFGQTEQQALEAAGTYGNLFQAFGLTQTAAREMSMTMVELAADLASFNNTSIDDAIEALRSGLSGETEPLKRFGIALNDARMKQEALALGIYDGNGALTAAQKAQAAYAVILNDTTLAQGDFERTSGGLANSLRIVEAQVKNLQTEFGTGFLESLIDVTNQSDDLKASLEDLRPTFREAGQNAGDLALGALQVTSNFYSMSRAIMSGNWDLVRRMLFATNEELVTLNQEALVGADSLSYYTARGSEMEAQLRANSAALRATAAATRDATGATLGLAEAQGQSNTRFQILAQLNKDPRWQDYKERMAANEQATRSMGGAASSTKQSMAELRSEMEKTFTQSMRDAITETTDSLAKGLESAKDKVTDFARNMQSTILQGFGIGKSFEGALNEEGKVNASAWIQAVDAEVAKWEWFGNVLQAVRGPGNDPARQALAEYLAGEGADKGGVMGQALIDNGLIVTMAEKMQLVRDQAGIVAQNMVPEFLKAGVDSAQNTYDGFKLAAGKGGPVYEALQGLMDRLAASMRRETTITVTTINRQINEVIGSFGYGGPRAMGGPVAADTAYLVGERGPELFVPDVSGSIVPNGGSPSSTGAVAGGGITLNVYAGMGTDGGDVGRQIVDALRQYERRNGPVPITVR
jgi:hypothetical protein